MTMENQIKWLGLLAAVLTAFVGVFAADIGDGWTRVVSFGATVIGLVLSYVYGVKPGRDADKAQKAAMAEMLRDKGQG